jgi:iron transport multicopper oxidase
MWRFARERAVLAALLLVAAISVSLPGASPAAAASPPVTYSNNNLRTGWYPNQPGLTPTQVASGAFGLRFNASVVGQVLAQPLVANGTLLVATEDNYVYGLDPFSGATKWARQLRKPFLAADVGCSDLVPNVGITGTPVVDPDTGTMYVIAKGYLDNNPANKAVANAGYWLYGIDITNGSIKFATQINGTKANNPATKPAERATFAARDQVQRPALISSGGRIYAAFSGHCGTGNYHGWVIGFTPQGAPAGAWSSTTNIFLNGGGIWMSGGGILSDAGGRLYIASGNDHDISGPSAETHVPDGCGNCVVRLQSNGSTLTATQFFSPKNTNQLSAADSDLGSGGLTELVGTNGAPRLFNGKRVIASAGKEGYVYLLDADHLGGYQQAAGAGDKVLKRYGRFGGVWSKPTQWPGDGGWLYIPTASPSVADNADLIASGSIGRLQAYQVGVDGAGNPSLTPATTGNTPTADETLGFGSSAPVVTSNGASAGSAVVWVIRTKENYQEGANAVLTAYHAVPSGGHMVKIREFPIGHASKFVPPGVANNRVYVGTRDGHVLAYGTPAAIVGSGVSFGSVIVGQAKSVNATLTMASAATISSVTVSGTGFVKGTCSCTGAKAQGSTIAVPVGFRPPSAGTFSGKITVVSDKGTFEFALAGRGVAAVARLSLSRTSIGFGKIAAGETAATSLTISNTGGANLVLYGVDKPAAPFTVAGRPTANTILGPGRSVAVTVGFAPTSTGGYLGVLPIRTSLGTVRVGLSGTAVRPAHLQVSNYTIDAGNVALGSSTVVPLVVSNTGELPLTITLSKAVQTAQFKALTPLAEGTTIPPGGSRSLQIQFTPTALGAAPAGVWKLNGSGTSVHTEVNFRGTGISASSIPAGMGMVTPTPNAIALDTRTAGHGRLAAGVPRAVQVAGLGGIPTVAKGATGALVNLVVVSPTGAGSAAVFPCGQAAPPIWTVTFAAGQTVSRTTSVSLPASGQLCIASSVITHAMLTVNGYTSSKVGYRLATKVAPARVLDTRRSGALRPYTPRTIEMVNAASLPGNAVGAVINVTAVTPSANGWLAVYPCGQPIPTAILNFSRGPSVSTTTMVRLGVSGTLCASSSVGLHAIVQVQGYLSTPAPSSLVKLVTPAKIYDSRSHGALSANVTRPIAVRYLGGVPSTAHTVIVTLAVTNAVANGTLTAFPCGMGPSGNPTMVYASGRTTISLATVRLDAAGRICVSSSAVAHVVVQTQGWAT